MLTLCWIPLVGGDTEFARVDQSAGELLPELEALVSLSESRVRTAILTTASSLPQS